MNRKQLTILVVLGVIVGAIGLITYQKRSQSWQASGPEDRESVFPEFAPDKVARINIQSATNDLSLVVQEGEWTVNERDNYPADFSKISELVTAVWELTPVRQVEVGGAQLGELSLLSPDQEGNTGTLVTFSDEEGNAIQSVLLGKEKTKERSSSSRFGGGSMPVGRYVRAAEEDAPVFLVEETFSAVEVDPSAWLDTTFFSVEDIRSVAMEGPEEAYQWKVSRETANGEWELANPKEGETLATNKVSSLGSAFSSPSFNDVITEQNAPDETGLNDPKVATIQTFEDFTYRVQIGKKTSDNEYPLKVEVSADLPPVPEPSEGGEGDGDGDNGTSQDEKQAAAEKRRKEIQELHDKLEEQKAYQKWTYLVPSYTVNSVLKKRSELMVQPEDESDDGGDSSGSGQSTQNVPPTPGSRGKSLVPSNIPGVDSGQEGSPASEGEQGSTESEEQGTSQKSADDSASGNHDGTSSEGKSGSAEKDESAAQEGDQGTGAAETADESTASGEGDSSGQGDAEEAGSNEGSDSGSSSTSGDSGGGSDSGGESASEAEESAEDEESGS